MRNFTITKDDRAIPFRITFRPGLCDPVIAGNLLKPKRFKTRWKAKVHGDTTVQKILLNTDSHVIETLGGFEPLKAVAEAGELTESQYDLLYPIYESQMPYGTAKARTGDPQEFILERLDNLVSRLIEKEKP